MDDVIIVGSLDKKELERSIQDLVDYVGNKTNAMATKFIEGLTNMKLAMKDFAITQKVSVDVMQEAWRKMSQSFDAMVAAQSASGSGGSGSGGKGGAYPDNTVGQLQEMIRLEEQRRKGMQLNSDELRQQNALLEQQRKELRSQTTSDRTKQAKSYKDQITIASRELERTLPQAEQKLRNLLRIKNELRSTPVLDSKDITRLDQSISKLIQRVRELRSKGTPKTMKEVLGMDESSVDAIAKKMAALKRVTIDPNNAAQVKRLGDEYQRLSRLQSDLLGRNIQATHSNNMLAQSFGYIRNRIVYALTLGAMTSFVKQVYEIRGQYELLERSLGVLVGSFERGTQIFKELNQMAIESPFTLMELAGAAKQLTAYNFEAKEVVDTTRRLADISAALGVPMERLTYNLGQIRAQTVLTARDARDFANAGLPIVAELAKHFTELEGRVVTTGDVYSRMSKKMVSYADVMSVINKVTDEGGKFFEFQAKQAQTLRVQMANLTLAWNNMLNELGESNQGVLTLFPQTLKALLQNWKTLDRIIKSLVLSFGLLKVAQMFAVNRFGVLATGLTTTAKQMGMLTNAAKSLWGSLAALATNPWTWVMVGITAFVDLAMQMKHAHDELVSLNNDIKKNANEASESMLDFLGNKGNRETYTLAKQNALTAEQGEKAWEGIQSQIEQSAMSSNKLIAELLQIEDINKRVKVGFDYISNIQKAQAALQDLKDTTIEFTSDKGWFGIFGEGAVSDLKDYARALERVNEGFSFWDRLQLETQSTRQGDVARMGKELADELAVTAESINNFINAYNITDPLQINEIYERVKAQIKVRNPEIKGELAHIFDIGLDQKMAQLTNNAIDSNTSLWNIFMERLRHNSSSTFQDITDDWVNDKQKTLSKAQQEAVDKNLEYFKNSMPYAYDAVAQMVKDASQLKIHIGITFGTGGLSDFQKEVQKRISQAPSMLDFGSNALLPTNQQDLTKWAEARRNDIKRLEADNKTYEQDNTAWAKEHIKNNNEQIQQNKNLLDLFHQNHKTQKEINAENRKNAAAQRKASAAQKHEIDEVANAIRDELSIVKEIQSNYDKLRKSGVANTDAINMASQGYETTLLRINNVLQKFGINKFNASDFAGKNVKQLLDTLTKQRDSLLASGKVKTSSLKDLDVEIQKLTIDAKTYDMKKITDSLNNELGKLKDEYELGIELDANPELGDVFADMMGIRDEQLESLPRDFEGVVRRLQNIIDTQLGVGKFNLMENLNKATLNNWLKQNQYGTGQEDAVSKALTAYVDYANKVRRDETKKQTDEWNKLLEKYSEYEYKVTQIHQQAERERETARKKNAPQNVIDAINLREQRDLAKLNFEEFQKSPEWVVATGDLAGLTDKALGGLIKRIEEYKKKARYLDPKQIKNINNALKNLRKQQREGNPFLQIANAIDEARLRAEQFQPQMDAIMSDIIALEKEIGDNDPTEEQAKHLKTLKDMWKELAAQGDVSATQLVEGINASIAAASQAISMFTDMADAIGGKHMTEATENIKNVVGVIEKAGQGAAIGAQIGSGYGAIIGAVVGGLSGLITNFADQWSGNKSITKRVQESERAVKRLETAYVDLQHAIDNAFGTAVVGAKQAALANKKAQLEEIQRQILLEKSREAKNRDDDKILDLQKQYKELMYEIKDGYVEIVDDLMGTNVASFAEDLVSSMIDAFREGEDYMKIFSDKFDEMIDNMIMKMIVSRVLTTYLDNLWKTIDERINARSEKESEAYEKAQEANNTIKTLSDDEVLERMGFNSYQIITMRTHDNARYKKLVEDYRKAAEAEEKSTKQALDAVSEINDSDITWLMEQMSETTPAIGEKLKEFISKYYTFGDKATSDGEKLSGLQQGIQSVTEETANALEAYMNGVSQQVYLHSDLLTQIRDAVVGFDLDVQTATVSQILLQLQNSYQVQMSIQSILSGWSNPSGMAMRVEMIS